MQGTFSNLWLACLTPEQHSRTCGYWYTVTDRATAHTAFRTPQALFSWLADRGLVIEKDIPSELGTHQSQPILGSYTEESWTDTKGFGKLRGKRFRILSNGRYTMGVITTDDDGHRTIHVLNPNCRRPDYDYAETRELIDAGN